MKPTVTPVEEGGSVSIVRELHVYGSVVPIHSRDPSKFQHQGFVFILLPLLLSFINYDYVDLERC